MSLDIQKHQHSQRATLIRRIAMQNDKRWPCNVPSTVIFKGVVKSGAWEHLFIPLSKKDWNCWQKYKWHHKTEIDTEFKVKGGRISPRVELLHRYVNQKVRSCRTANGGSTFGSELASSQNKKEIRQLRKQVLVRVQASLGLRRSSVYPALRPEGASSYGFPGDHPQNATPDPMTAWGPSTLSLVQNSTRANSYVRG